MGDDYFSFGGVRLKKSEVASTSTRMGESFDATKGKVKNYIVSFKNGTKIAYTYTSDKRASINSPAKNRQTDVMFVKNVELKGSSKGPDEIIVVGGSVRQIDVAGDGGGDRVYLRGAEFGDAYSSHAINNKACGGNVHTDKGDKVDGHLNVKW